MSEQKHLDNEADLKDYINVMIKRKKTILIIFSLCVIIATVISFLRPKAYEAATIISIPTPTHIAVSKPLMQKGEAIQKLKTGKILIPVIQTFNLGIDGFTLEKMMKTENIENTNLLKLKIQYEDPQLAVKICNAIADYFVQQANEIRDERLSPINEKIGDLRKRSEIIEKEIQKLNQMLSSEISNVDFVILQNALSNYQTLYFNINGEIYLLRKELMDYQLFEVFEPATMSVNIKPNKRLNITASAILGLIIGIFAAFLQEFARNN